MSRETKDMSASPMERLDASDLMKLSREERAKWLAKYTALAEKEYLKNAELTDFDLFDEESVNE